MVQRLSASPEQHLQRPACMFEAAFICIYRELGLTVCVWKLVPLIAVAFSLEKGTAGFQMLESPLAHFHTLSRGDSLGAFATTRACGGRIQPLLRRRLLSCQTSVNGDYWWLVFGLYWFWNCEGWWGSNSLLWKSTWWHVMQAFHGVFPPVRSECFKSSILHGSNEGLIGGFDHRHLERNSKVQQERMGAGVKGFEGPWTLKDMISRYSTTVTFSSSLGRSSAWCLTCRSCVCQTRRLWRCNEQLQQLHKQPDVMVQTSSSWFFASGGLGCSF